MKIYPQPRESGPGLLYFSQPKIKRGWLEPHEAASGQLLAQSLSLPSNSVWRAEFSVSEKLSGREAEEVRKKLEKVVKEKEIPEMVMSSPNDPDGKYYGHAVIVYSNEVRP